MNVNDLKNVMTQKLMFEIMKKSTNNSPAFGVLLESLSKIFEENNIPMQANGESVVLENSVGIQNNHNIKSISGKSNKSVDKNKLMYNIKGAVRDASKKYGIDENLIMSVIKQESGFNPYAKSNAGAEGLMQLMPGTARGLGVSNSFNVNENVNGGTKYLRNLLNMYGNCKQMALAAYNAGCGTVARRGVKGVEDIDRMPRETVNYVKKVMKSYGENL